MIWAKAIRNAMIATAVLAVATLIYKIVHHAEASAAAMLPMAVPLFAGTATAIGVTLYRHRRRAALVRRLRA